MANQPRTPSTLKAYITALCLFYKFVIARRHTITSELHITINTEYLDELQSCDALLNGWLASLSAGVQARKKVLRQHNFDERLTSGEYREVANNEESKQAAKNLFRLENSQIRGVTCDEFARYRDCIMLRLLCCAAQYPGAIANLTVQEIREGHWDETSNNLPLFVTETEVRKTSKKEGAACLFFNKQL